VANKDLDRFVKNLNNTIESLTDKKQLESIGQFIVEKIKVRTRLGSGVEENLQEKFPLRNFPITEKYIMFRKKFKGLSTSTTPTRNNLTLTGSMLDSLKVKAIGKNAVVIGPTGSDRSGVSNESKTKWQAERNRIYMKMSFQEVKQVRIFWLRSFSGLLKNK
jgi:hypothetical protein